jgi:L-threonylcarbamoyladenylate synthase
MTVLRIDPQNPDSSVLARAAQILRDGGLVAFPTETVYGLGANALSESAVEKIFQAKQRPHFNPLIVHLSDQSRVLDIAQQWPESAQILAQHFWPGPLTLVLPKRETVPHRVTAGLQTVAVRVPAHPVARALLQAAQLPVAAPSANLFMQLSPTRAEHVAQGLGNRVDLILDGGPCDVGIESTVLSLVGTPTLLRPGSISRAQIEKLIGPVSLPQKQTGNAPQLAPGMLERHYAPRAKLIVFHSREEAQNLLNEALAQNKIVGALLRETEISGAHFVEQMPRHAFEYSQRLYAALHEKDDANCDLILVESVPDDSSWDGIRDRLARAGFRDT